ncbi:HipA family kinase [Catenovulum sediminis]|uniref:HipA family kinase n=1 Tax=Catenovulum sediminis TaxID=1740262 RepID=A0ABV1RE75_9ALTE
MSIKRVKPIEQGNSDKNVICIVEIIHQMTQGATGPYLCLADNGKKYVIKRQRAGFEGCIKEWLFGKLGQDFGLPIPNCELVYVDSALLEYNSDYQFEIGEGVAFASEFIPDLQEVNYQILHSLSQETLRDLYVFDYWIKNADRNLTKLGGNPNLFYAQSSLALKVVDHNLAFDNGFLIAEHHKFHVSSDYWPAQIDYDVLQNYEQRMADAFANWQQIVEQIPEDWREGVADYHGIIERMTLRLNEYLNQKFWEGLK